MVSSLSFSLCMCVLIHMYVYILCCSVPFIYVVGHHSWSDVQAKASSLEGCISIGPWGHLEGEPWAYNPEGRISQITVCNGSVVDSLSFQSESSNGVVVLSEKYGGPGGSRCETVSIAMFMLKDGSVQITQSQVISFIFSLD